MLLKKARNAKKMCIWCQYQYSGNAAASLYPNKPNVASSPLTSDWNWPFRGEKIKNYWIIGKLLDSTDSCCTELTWIWRHHAMSCRSRVKISKVYILANIFRRAGAIDFISGTIEGKCLSFCHISPVLHQIVPRSPLHIRILKGVT